MKRLSLTCMLVAMALLPGSNRSAGMALAGQADPTPTVTPLSEPVRSGDWTFQLLDVERLETYYAERLGQVFEPEGIFLIVGLAITYEGTSTNDLDRFLSGNICCEVTAPDGTSYQHSAEAFAAFAVEESYREDTPYPRLPSNGVAEPGITHYTRYIFDVPADATGLELTSGPWAPEPFAIPLPDPEATEGERVWELIVTSSELRQTLEPPLTENRYEAEGVYVVVYVRLTKLQASPGGFSSGWFALRAAGGDTFEVAVEESFATGTPSASGEPGTWEFALVFDLPESAVTGLAGLGLVTLLTLVSIPGAPLEVEIPLNPTLGPTPAPVPTSTPTATRAPSAVATRALATATPPPAIRATRPPTSTPTVLPTATTAPTATATPAPTATATSLPTETPTPTETPVPTATPAPTATASSTPAPTATRAPARTPPPNPTPAPGAIRVVAPVAGSEATGGPPPGRPLAVAGAVELILDTSGSMLQPMGDRLRIDVAREVLTEVVTQQLPPGTQTALRVFGTVPGSCETSLAIPLGPLDPAFAAARIAEVVAINEVRTPLGASLQAAGADLAAVEGPKLIVLVTDGEETCGGDPGATIDALVAQGIDVRVNIVGFAIDDPAVAGTLADWAARGGGEYFPANDAADLGPALTEALQPTFDVLDDEGARIASGTVNGEAVPVPSGSYTVRVNTDPPLTIESVVVEPGETTEVRLEEEGG